jgi:S1-C subfamily serine protease
VVTWGFDVNTDPIRPEISGIPGISPAPDTDRQTGSRASQQAHQKAPHETSEDDTGDWLTEAVESGDTEIDDTEIDDTEIDDTEIDDTGSWESTIVNPTVHPTVRPTVHATVHPTTTPLIVPAQKPAPISQKAVPASKAPKNDSPKRPRPPSPGKPPKRPLWRGRIIPKTVLGISFTMLTTGLALAVSGTLLFMNYRFRQDQSDALVKNFPAQVRAAQRAVENEGINARALVQQELDPLRKLAATAETLGTVLEKSSPSIWAVRTFDVDGQPTAGSAFAVASDDEKTFLLTSLNVVAAATTRPGPKLMLRQGSEELEGTLWTWQENTDLALLIVKKGNLAPLSWAAPDSTVLGDQVFSVSGLGSSKGAITEGRVAEVSSSGLQHSAQIGTAFRGGPILDSQGRVIAVGSRSYAPLGFVSEDIFFAPLVQASCETILKCSGGRVEGAGAQR